MTRTLFLALALFVVLAGEPVYRQVDLFSQDCIREEDHPFPPLWGNCPYQLEAQNISLLEHGVALVENESALRALLGTGELVTLARRGEGFQIYHASRGMLRPAAAAYLEELGSYFYGKTGGQDFLVKGTLRLWAEHAWMLERKRLGDPRFVNAASCETPLRCSPHLSGYAFDIRLSGLRAQDVWVLRWKLERDQGVGRVIVIEEVKSNALHIFVVPTAEEVPMALTPVDLLPARRGERR